GRVTPDDASELVQSYRNDTILLRRLRGRTIYDRPLQAADHFIRAESGNLAIDALQPVSVEQRDDQWHIGMQASDGSQHRAIVESRRHEKLVFKGWFSEEPSPVEHYYLVEYGGV